MARRTLTAHSLEFHRKYKRGERETIAPSDLDGFDLADVFQRWCEGLDSAVCRDEERKLWVTVQNVWRRSPHIVLVTLAVGTWGESGDVVDAFSGEKIFELQEDQAPTGPTRAVMLVPGRGETALYFSEYSNRGSGGSRLLPLFSKFWSHEIQGITMVKEPVVESEAWTQGASLLEVEVRVRGRAADIADPIRDDVGVQSHVIRPKKNHRFPIELLDRLRRVPTYAGDLVGLPSLPEESEVYVTIEGRNGRSKKLELYADGGPSLREVLNEADQPPLSDDVLIGRAIERASDLLARIGQEWKPEWNR